MSMISNPITLPVSKYLSAMTTLIADIRFHDTLSPSNIVRDLVDSTSVGNVDYGKGIVYTFKLDTLAVSDLTEVSSAFTINKPAIGQETILIDQYKKTSISTSEYLSRDAVVNGTQATNFFAFVMSLINDTHRFYMFDIMNNIVQNWTPGQATQTIEIPIKPIAGLTGADLNATKQYNATVIAETMRKTVNNMMIKNSQFTDVATYTDPNDGSTKNVVSALAYDDLKIIWNDNYYTDFLANAMASLYHNEEVGRMIPGTQILVLPTDAMTQNNATTIAWVTDKMKFAHADFYRFAMSILDPSTTYLNSFYHWSYGAGVFKYAPGVKFVAVEEAAA